MQSVRYINPIYNEVVIGDEPPFIFHKISGIGPMDAEIIASDPTDLDGAIFNNLVLPAREITITMHIEGKNRADMYANKMRLSALLSPEHNKNGILGRFEYTNDYGTWWIPAAVKRGPQGNTRMDDFLVGEQLVWYCPNPYWRGTKYNRARMAYLGGGLRFPLRLGEMRFGSYTYQTSLYNFGDRPSHAEINITGPAVQPEIIKVSTGEFIRLRENKELFDGDVLQIDTTPGRIRAAISKADGTKENAIGYIHPKSDYFTLRPGENVMKYASQDDSQTTLIDLATLPWFGGV